jgi:hypothetical protein
MDRKRESALRREIIVGIVHLPLAEVKLCEGGGFVEILIPFRPARGLHFTQLRDIQVNPLVQREQVVEDGFMLQVQQILLDGAEAIARPGILRNRVRDLQLQFALGREILQHFLFTVFLFKQRDLLRVFVPFGSEGRGSET